MYKGITTRKETDVTRKLALLRRGESDNKQLYVEFIVKDSLKGGERVRLK